MLKTLNDLFRALSAPSDDHNAAPSEHTLQLATAVLLVEMMRAETRADGAERETALAALRAHFALADDELGRLVELAEAKASEAPDFYSFTSQLNKGFDLADKVRIVESLWQIALADGVICHHENHLMRKLGDLLHIPRGDYVAAKQRARDKTVRD